MKISKDSIKAISKFGIRLWAYETGLKDVGFVHTEVETGHFEEFYHRVSTFIYYIAEGEGKFFLDGVETPVKAGDLLVIPPNTRIHYRGRMTLNLITTPAWREEDEVHVRDIKTS